MKKALFSMMILSIILMDILTGMEFDLFVPAFAQLQSHFHISSFWTEALLSVNFLGYLLSLFFVGTLADHYGRKPVILYGLLIFIVGSFFCLFANNYALLLFGRFLQGIGIAAPAILSFLIIADRYPIKQQQFFMAMLNGSLNIAAGIAPVVGSYITLYYHWRGNFVALLLLGIISWAMALVFISKDSPKNREKKSSSMGYFQLFKSKELLLLVGNIILMCIPYWIFVGMSPLLYIKSLHVTLHFFGFYQGILAFSFAIGSIILGFMINRFSQRSWLTTASYIYILSLALILLVTLTGSKNPLFITGAMLAFCMAQIIPSIILYPLCLNFIPEAKAKVAAIQQGGRLVFTALALEMAGYFYHGSFYTTGMMIAFFIAAAIISQIAIMKNPKIVIQG